MWVNLTNKKNSNFQTRQRLKKLSQQDPVSSLSVRNIFVSRPGLCSVPKQMRKEIPECSGSSDKDLADEEDYGVFWAANASTSHKHFKFHSSLSVHGVPYSGNVGK